MSAQATKNEVEAAGVVSLLILRKKRVSGGNVAVDFDEGPPLFAFRSLPDPRDYVNAAVSVDIGKGKCNVLTCVFRNAVRRKRLIG